MTTKVVLDSLRKEFASVVALYETDLKIEQGEFVCLLGPSGSGKTTLLRLIAGFEQPTSGEIYIDGQPAHGLPPHRRNLGMVAQDYALFPHMTVAQNVSFGLRMRRVPAAEISQRVDEALRLVDLDGYADRAPHQLSGGQQQRVALARALVTRPSVLLLDEPFGALDKKLREQLQIEVRHLQRQVGITTIFVTHDQSEALTMSDRIAVLQKGRIVQVGSPLQIYERPATRFVADFIGLTNFIEATVVAVESEKIVLKGPGEAMLAAASVDWARPGMRVELAVRPEKISFGESKGEMNSLPVRIKEIVYLGDRTRHVVELRDGSSCVVLSQNQGTESRAAFSLDQFVNLTWHWRAGIILRS